MFESPLHYRSEQLKIDWSSSISGPPLGIVDLATVFSELHPCRAKWHHLGIQLRVDVGSLDQFMVQYADPSDKLMEVINTWLTTSDNPSWEVIVEALKSPVIGEGHLAVELQQKYCSSGQHPVDGEWLHVTSDSQFGCWSRPWL